jgi:hypothetical protein
MTAQISDIVRYLDRNFSLSGVKGTGLFDPRQHGLEPQMLSTACYRGFICTYRVVDEGLYLEELRVGLSHEQKQAINAGKGPLLFGQKPHTGPDHHSRIMYSGLHSPVAFSGGLLLADGFMRELYVHMGFHPAWKFREVHELLFEEGMLVEAVDCSAAMARVRERMKQQPLKPGAKASEKDVEAWVERCFRLDYD